MRALIVGFWLCLCAAPLLGGCAAFVDAVQHPNNYDTFKVPINTYVRDLRGETAICSTVGKDGKVQMAWSCR